MGVVDVAEAPDGTYIVGDYVGVKAESTWTPPGETAAVRVPPKLGVSVNGRDVLIRAKSVESAKAAAPGAAKGDRVAVRVRVFPGRNGNGVKYVLPDADGGDGGGDWV